MQPAKKRLAREQPRHGLARWKGHPVAKAVNVVVIPTSGGVLRIPWQGVGQQGGRRGKRVRPVLGVYASPGSQLVQMVSSAGLSQIGVEARDLLEFGSRGILEVLPVYGPSTRDVARAPANLTAEQPCRPLVVWAPR